MVPLPERDRDDPSGDTSREVEARQLAAWGAMSSIEMARTLNAAWKAGQRLALLGLRERYPTADADELRIRLAVMTLGVELASRVHGDVARFADSANHG